MRRTAMVVAAALLFSAVAMMGTPVGADESAQLIPTRVVMLSDHATPVKTWSPLEVRARVETLDGAPLAGRSVRVWDDSYERWRCCGPPPLFTTDANGEIATVLHLDGNSAHPVRVAVYTYGDDVYDKSIAEWYQPLVGYDTSLDVAHATKMVGGQPVSFSVSVRRTDPQATTGCIDGAVVRIGLDGPSPRSLTAVVDHDPFAGTCNASVDVAGDLTPGTYTITASTGHDGWRRTDEPQRRHSSLEVPWQHVYHDAEGGGSIYLHRASGDYRVVLADGRDSGIRSADTLSRTGVSGTLNLWRINLSDTDGDEWVTGEFYSTGAFAADGHLRGSGWQLRR